MIFLQILFYASFGWAQSTTDGILIKNADSMFHDNVKKTMKLEGRVHVVFQHQSLTCDSALINMEEQTLEAHGHVILESLKAHLEGTNLRFNYKTNTGIFYNGFVQSGQVIFEGDIIEKIGPDNYIAQNAEFTACDTCPPGWAFSGRTIEAQVGGYAYIHRPVFKVGGIPIFIFWAMMVPLKSTRQSGFLVPQLDFTPLGGAAVSDSYFWAIDKSSDLTLTTIHYERRGWKEHADYRYVLSDKSRGRLETAAINDRALAGEYTLNESATTRWFVHYQHMFELPDDWISRVDVKPVSDLRYPRDFPEELLGNSDPSLENRLSFSKATETTAFSIEGDRNTNLLKYYPLSDNSDAVHRMPEIRYAGTERRIGGAWGPLFRWNLDYVDFVRDGYSYDNLIVDPNPANHGYLTGNIDQNTHLPIRTGVFNPATDILRTGQRLDFSPTVSYPFHILNVFDVIPSVTYRETQYRFDVPATAEAAGYGPTAARRYVQADIDAKTQFAAIYGGTNDDKGTRWKHSFEPEISYDTIPWMRSPVHPFFGNTTGLPYYTQYNPLSDADVIGNNKLQFDYDDRVYDRSLTTVTLTNKLVRKRWDKAQDKPIYERVALFSISQAYDFEQENSGQYPPWSPITTLTQVNFQNVTGYSLVQYDTYARVANETSTITGKINDRNALSLSYNHNYLFDNYSLVVPGSETEVWGIGMGVSTKYVDLSASINFSPRIQPTGLQSFSYVATLKPPGNCWHLQLQGSQALGGQTAFKFNFAFDFAGGPPQANSTNATQIGTPPSTNI